MDTEQNRTDGCAQLSTVAMCDASADHPQRDQDGCSISPRVQIGARR